MEAGGTLGPMQSQSTSGDVGLERADLIEVYKAILEEYRFQVQYNWERVRYCLTLSVTLSAAAYGLLGASPGGWLAGAALMGFVGAIAVALLGVRVTRKGHEYYRAIRATKRNAEQALGLPDLNLAIEPTRGIRERAQGTADAHRLIRKDTINDRLLHIFYVLTAINAVGMLVVIGRYCALIYG
jgi:hypothetical protein